MPTNQSFVNQVRRSSSSTLFFYLLLYLSLISLIILNVEDRDPPAVADTGGDGYSGWKSIIKPSADIDVRQFAELLDTGEAGLIRGVYVEDKFAFPVIQQPEGKDLFVSSKLGRVTQFNLAAQNGITGLLAHNFLSGKEFYEIETGDTVWIIYADKELVSYQVTSIRSYQKLDPSSPHSDYHDMYDHTRLTTSELFGLYYRGPHHVTFQTCLEKDGRQDWGLLFVVAR